MAVKVLIFGLPGSGKSSLAKDLGMKVFDGDEIRQAANNSDFSLAARVEQARLMGKLMAEFKGDSCAAFICPTVGCRRAFMDECPEAITIWMDTIQAGRFEDTNAIFEKPSSCDLRITDFNYGIKKVKDFIEEAL